MRQRDTQRSALWLTGLCLIMVGLLVGALPAWSQFVEPPNPLGSLKTVPTPEPANLNQFLKSDGQGRIFPAARAAAIALGKALFWDQAAGSAGQACASCHFNAGADSRTRNQLNPGFRAIPSQTHFGAMPPQQTTGTAPAFTADYHLRASDFPFTKFNDQTDRNSGIISDTQAIASSQGVFNSDFRDITPTSCPTDQLFLGTICDKVLVNTTGNGAIFNTTASPLTQVRNVEPRNTPSNINAVFNFRNCWDGRARNEFNGVNPIGDLDPYARVLMTSGNGAGATLQKVSLSGSLRLEDASLASQAVGPALSDLEMSAAARTFAKLGKKMLALRTALPAQLVAPNDSVLGNNVPAGVKSNAPLPGINKAYGDLIQAAFQSRWYGSNSVITFPGGTDADGTVTMQVIKQPKGPQNTDQYTQIEANFSLFWGIAIQMYEATLRSDDSPFDQAFDSGNPLTFQSPLWGDREKLGLNVFQGAGGCIACHSGPEFTNASVRNVRAAALENMNMGNGKLAVYDTGFYNIGVRRCLGSSECDDIGVGATIGPLNQPLSMSRFAQRVFAHDANNPSDPITIVCANQPTACTSPLLIPVNPTQRVAVDGALKAPGLRNIALTAPYMHHGGELTLRDVIEFYDRGGTFSDYNIANLDPDIGILQIDPTTGQPQILPRDLSPAEIDGLIAFMEALTDARVQFQRAPFDHPQIFIPNLPADPNCLVCKPGELPAVGRNGSTTALPTFFDSLAP